MGVPGKTEGTIFSPIPCEVTLTGPERVGGNVFYIQRSLFFNPNTKYVLRNFKQNFGMNVSMKS